MGKFVAEATVRKSGRLGDASNGLGTTRRSSGWLHLRRRGSNQRLDGGPRAATVRRGREALGLVSGRDERVRNGFIGEAGRA